jgi:apolipoprotein N-acyltransferase
MESVASFFTEQPAAATLLAVFVVVMILYFILKKFIKLAVVLLFFILLAVGIYLFKDPTTTPEKIATSVETLQTGGKQIGEKLSGLWRDTRELAGKAKEVPADLNDMLDAAKKDVGK